MNQWRIETVFRRLSEDDQNQSEISRNCLLHILIENVEYSDFIYVLLLSVN